LNLNSARSALALHFFLSLSSVSFFVKPTKGKEEDLLGISLWMSRDLQNSFLLVLLAWHRGNKGSPRPPCQNPSPSLLLRPPMLPPTPNQWKPSCWPPRSTPPHRDRPSCPMPPLNIAIALRGRPIGAESHRPPPAPSLHHQPRADPHDQFPEPNHPEPQRACHPDHADPTRPSRLVRPGHASRSRAPRPRLTPLITRTSMAR
jgi:hypothetical protein